jgi:uncharacterized protein YneF (UPF0154 family)
MKKSLAAVLIVLSLFFGVSLGYYFGYDIGWEKAIRTLQK